MNISSHEPLPFSHPLSAHLPRESIVKPAKPFLLFALLLGLVTTGPLFAQDKKEAEKKSEEAKKPVVSIFPDKALESVVRRNVFEKRDNDEPLTAKDVEKISTVEGKGKGIRDLRGLEHCISLQLLDLENNDIADIDPIMGLKNLQSINLAKNRIGDLTAITKLTRIQYLHLANNRIVDLQPLEGLQNLRSLYLSNNKIKELTSIAELEKIWSLYFDGNRVKSLQPLAKLRWLSNLDIRRNGLEDLAPLKALTEIKYLAMDKNKISDLTPLVEMAEKDAEGEQRFSPFWRIYLADNPLSDKAKEQLNKIKELGGRISEEAIPE